MSTLVLSLLVAFVLFMIFNALAGGARPAKAARRVRRRGRSRDVAPLVIAGALLFAMMTVLDLDWLAHPVAGLGLAWYASLVFRRRLALPRIALALGLLGLASVAGASWVVFPLGGITLAWFATLLFRGPVTVSSSWTTVRPELTSGSATPLPDLDDVGEDLRERVRVRPSRRERRRERAAAPAPAAPPPPIGEDYATPLDQLLNANLARLPEEARVRLADLGRRVRAVQGDLERRGEFGGETRFLLRQTATDYAPGAVNAYLRLPPSVANVTPLADGKTGKDLLIGQLDLLLSAVEAASTDAAHSAGQELLAHGRFLEDKFGKKDFDI